MATNRMPFRTSVFVFFAFVLDCRVYAGSLTFSALSSLPASEGDTLTLSCEANRTGISFGSQLRFSSASLSTYSSQCSVDFRDQCSTTYRPGCYCYSNSSTVQTFRMTIHHLQLSEALFWRCDAPSSFWFSSTVSLSNSLRVSVNGRPTRPNLSSLSPAVPVGGDVTLTCSSQPTSMPVDIRTTLEFAWRRNGNLVLEGDSSRLQLRNVSEEVEGTYSCTAMESGKILSSETSNEIYVNVQYPASHVSLIPPTSSYEVRETMGSVPDIWCQADCDPPCLLWWTDKDGNPVGLTGSNLQLTSLDRKQSGVFTCSAYNQYGVSRARVNITAIYPPEVTLTQTEVRLEEGDNVTVLCHVDASPPAVVSWSKLSGPGQVTLQSSPLLELRGVGEGDAGLYTCSATNRLSSQESPSQASLRVHVTSQQTGGQLSGQAGGRTGEQISEQPSGQPREQPVTGAPLTWTVSMGVGLVIGFVIAGVILGLLCFLLVRRRQGPREMPGTNADCTYENLDLTTRQGTQDNDTYESIHQHENQGFAKNEGTNSGSQTLAKPDLKSQAAGEARTSRQTREEDKKQSKAAERQKGTGKADEKGSRQSEVEEGEIGSGKEEENGMKKRNGGKTKEKQSRAVGMEGRKNTEVKEEERKKGEKSRGKEKEGKESDVKQSPMTEEPLYINY